MSTPRVSVVIPAYNHERFVGAAVESVLSQTFSDLELIVIDDGSRDRTGEVVRGYADSRLSYYFQENQDAYNTINRGLGLARGEFIAILNSDDVYTPDRLERLLLCREQTGAECIFTDVIPISDEGEEFTDPDFGWNVWHRKNRTFYRQCGDLYTAFLKGNFMVTTSNLFMTARAVREVGTFCSLRYLHDYDYIFRLMLANPGKVHYLEQEKLLYYRIHSGNTLGEAAITGRLQDQQLIRKYMLEVIPAAQKGYVEAGADRLVELEQELNAVRGALQPAAAQGVRPAARQLLRSLKTWLGKKIG
ncbi:MAG: glycosyltransferase [Desulfobulbaceae bacterium]|nr:MAG: glycosyltransferase [Desulfobulbaceae bacterium]